MPSSRRSSWSRIASVSLKSPVLAGGFFTTSSTWEWEAPKHWAISQKKKSWLGKIVILRWGIMKIAEFMEFFKKSFFTCGYMRYLNSVCVCVCVCVSFKKHNIFCVIILHLIKKLFFKNSRYINRIQNYLDRWELDHRFILCVLFILNSSRKYFIVFSKRVQKRKSENH